jgi:hydroxymethylpyrimidine pyrophosphatase-like HAD family hydrolase
VSKQKAIIVDLDGTLCNVDHRVHFVRQKPKNWQAFNQGMINDELNLWCFELIKAMKASGYHILFVTGRDDHFKNQTMTWLNQHLIVYDKLFMRLAGDFREDSEVKEEIFKKDIEKNYQVLFVVDDRKSVVDKWRELDLICLQCAVGNF